MTDTNNNTPKRDTFLARSDVFDCPLCGKKLRIVLDSDRQHRIGLKVKCSPKCTYKGKWITTREPVDD